MRRLLNSMPTAKKPQDIRKAFCQNVFANMFLQVCELLELEDYLKRHRKLQLRRKLENTCTCYMRSAFHLQKELFISKPVSAVLQFLVN